MANLRRLPPADSPGPVVLQPETDADRADRLEEQVKLLEAENGRLRAYLNDLQRLTQRVLALRASRGRLLWLAIGAAILLYVGIPGTLGNRVLVAGWQKLFHPPPQVHAHVRPAVTDLPPESPTVAPSPATVPPATPSLNQPTAPPPRQYGLNPPSDGPTKIMVLPSPLPRCNGNHLPTDPICPPMGHRPKPSPSLPLPPL